MERHNEQTSFIKTEKAKTLDELLAEQDADDYDDSEEGFLERLKRAAELLRTPSDELTDLYRDDKKAYEDRLEELAGDIAMQNPLFIANIAERKRLRALGKEQSPESQQIKHQQNQLMAKYRRFIASEAGLPDEDRFHQIEQAKTSIHQMLVTAHGETYTPTQAIDTLGIREYDSENEKIAYRFPDEIFPECVTEKWETYLAIVCKESQAANRVKNGDDNSKDEAIRLDHARKLAHDSVTRDVHAILGFESVDKNWDFLKTRQLLATIRDNIFPDTSSTLSPEAHLFVNEHNDDINTCSRLSYRSH